MKSIVPVIVIFLIGIQVFAQRPSLSPIQSWGYQLQDIIASEVAANSTFQLVVMDYSSDGTEDTKFTFEEIRAIRESGKKAVAYFSIGEAEDYRFYWKPEWNSAPPAWLGPENPEWPGNYKVRFWHPDWQAIVFGYMDKIIAQGFDGIYLDIIDGFSYWMHDNIEQPAADTLMVDFVRSIRSHASAHAPGTFYACGTSTLVSIFLFDAAGRMVQSLYAGKLRAGQYTLPLHAEGLKSGIYFLSMQTSANGVMTPVRVTH